ncbi:class E sortase [Actinotalea sp. M2MS4P-6]|uniref:class E sortase n=1 Tax=Actinotalea sp. M2MS4P-6 TaxID=2983762 RepID=UPI00398C4EB2
MITLGVLLGLFVVWQLWWTDVLGERTQAQAIASLDWDPRPLPPAGDEPTATATPHREPAPVLDEPASGTTFATMVVPRWGSAVLPISQGTSTDVLDVLGVGHYDGTAMPGQVGNFSVAGHRVTHGKPFNRIEEIQVGDPLVVRTEDLWFVYRVTSTEVVRPVDVEVIAPVPGEPGVSPTEAQMTMTTCHPMYSARERYVVHARLDYWLPAAEGTPVELEPALGST